MRSGWSSRPWYCASGSFPRELMPRRRLKSRPHNRRRNGNRIGYFDPMTDIDAPMRYAEPIADRTGRDRSVGLVVLVALGLAIAAVGLAIMSRELAEPFVLAILAGLAV